MRVLIAGAGFVGAHLAGELARQGHVVHALRRHEAPLPPGVRSVLADVTDPASLRSLPGDLDVAFFTASADESSDSGYAHTYVKGLSCLAGAPAVKNSRGCRVIFTSSTAVYAQREAEWVDETSPTEPRHFTGRRMLEAERVLTSAVERPIVVRLSGIYGPGRSRLLERVRLGEARYTPGLHTNRIHRDDASRMLAHLAELAHPERVYVGSDLDPAEQQVVYSWLAEQLGAPPPLQTERPELTSRETNKRCRPAALLASGFVFEYPSFREGYAVMLGRQEGAR